MKMTFFTIAALTVLFFCFVSIEAQTKPKRTTVANPTPSPSPTPKEPVTTQAATTEDGRAVILRSDGTWEYDKNPKPIPTPVKVAVEENGTLSFETGLVMKSGDVKPVARATFYLLDKDLENILTSSGFRSEGGSSILSTFALKYVSRQLEQLRGASVTTFDKTMESVKPHIIASTTTDFGGKGQFSSVKPGTYYLMHVGEIGRNVVLWNLKVELKAGQNSLTLDQNNAATAF